MKSLINLLDRHTPIGHLLAMLIVIIGIFVLAWLISRVATRLADYFVDRSNRRRSGQGQLVDTGVIAGLRQRQTAISLIATSVRYLAFAFAVVLAIVVLSGAQRLQTIVGASFLAVVVGFAAQRFLMDVIAGLLMFFEGWFRIGDTVAIDAWNAQGVVEAVSLRSLTIVKSEIIHVPNSQVVALRVGRGVAAEAREDTQRGRGADVDDRAPRLRPHQRQHRLGGDQRRDHVQLEHRTEVRRVEVGHRDVQPLARIVDEHVDPSMRLDGPGDETLDLFGSSDIGRYRERVRQFRGERLSRSVRRAARTTLAPLVVRRRAVAAPIPDEAPVTTQTVPSTSTAAPRMLNKPESASCPARTHRSGSPRRAPLESSPVRLGPSIVIPRRRTMRPHQRAKVSDRLAAAPSVSGRTSCPRMPEATCGRHPPRGPSS